MNIYGENIRRKLNIIDLFAGCGGLTEGFEQSGKYNSIACVEWDKAPIENLKKRLKEKWKHKNVEDMVLRFDIQRTDELIYGWKDDIQYGSHCGLEKLVLNYNCVDIIIGGPPCQAYSIAGRINKENKMEEDYRNYLFESYVKVVNYFKPKVFVFENVEGMLSAKPGGKLVTDLIRKGFDDIGYEIIYNLRENALLDLADFGIPQNRKRVIILGIRKDSFDGDHQKMLQDFYINILSKYHVGKKKTVKDSIFDLPKMFPTEQDYKIGSKKYSHAPIKTGMYNHIPRYHNRRDIEIFKELAFDIKSGVNKYIAIDALKNLYTEKTGKKANVHKYYVLRWNEPSNTIPAHLCKDGLRHIHPDYKQARSITVREAARLQTFPDDYEFIGSMMWQYKMIGNAVPPLFAKILAESVYTFIKKYHKENLI
ncbi:DNA cytosine methyltransferase [Clostridium botulinum]|nr:DNA cytosine methyltransferase [Clostridium botulinum]